MGIAHRKRMSLSELCVRIQWNVRGLFFGLLLVDSRSMVFCWVYLVVIFFVVLRELFSKKSRGPGGPMEGACPQISMSYLPEESKSWNRRWCHWPTVLEEKLKVHQTHTLRGMYDVHIFCIS